MYMYVRRSYTCSTLHSFCSCAATPQVLLGKHIEFPWLPIVVGFVSVFITIVSHQTSFEYRKPNILFISRHACAALDLGQANQTRHKGLRGKDAGVKIHPLTSSEVWSNSLVSQQFLPPVIIYPMVCGDASLQKAFSGEGVPHSVLPFVGHAFPA